jgi:hypothetical protein
MFWGTCHIRFQGQGMNEASSLLHTGLFLCLFFDPENEGYMFPSRTLLMLNFPILSPAEFWVCRKSKTDYRECGIILAGQALFMP